jgi:hypothetical protein
MRNLILASILLSINFVFAATSQDRFERHRVRIIKPIAKSDAYNSRYVTTLKSSDYTDIKLSETVSPASFSQKNSNSAALTDGKFVMAWQDKREGSFKIYVQVYDASGNVLNGNMLVAGRADGYNLVEPFVESDNDGGFYLGWRDEADGCIRVGKYNADLSEKVAPFIASEQTLGAYAGPYDLAVYGSANLAVVWENYSTVNSITLRIYSSDGSALTDFITVNDDVGEVPHWVPSVAFDNLGRLVVVWEDYRLGNADIFMQLVNANGSLNGTNLGLVAAQYDDSSQYLPHVAFSARDGFAVGWLDNRGVSQQVYLQIYHPVLGLVGGNTLISNNDESTENWDIAMAVNSSGNLNMLWSEINAIDNVILQRFKEDIEADGAPVIVNSHSDGSRWESSLSIGDEDKIICSWTDFRNGNGDIYFQYLTSMGTSLFGDDRIINDDSEGSEATNSDIVITSDGNRIALFADNRDDAGDIYLQLITQDGILSGSNVCLNSDPKGVLQNEPAIAILNNNALVVWNDSRSVSGVSGQRIFGRYVNSSGNFISDDFVVSDSGSITSKQGPAVTLNDNGIAFVAWVDLATGSPKVLARMLDDNGAYLTGVFLVSADVNDIGNDDISIDSDNSGNFTVGWVARGAPGGAQAIFARYGENGAFIDRFEKVSLISGAQMEHMDMAINGNGQIFAVWSGSDDNLYFSSYMPDGTVVVSAAELETGSMAEYQPDITVDEEGTIVITWISSISGNRKAYYHIFNDQLFTLRQGLVSEAPAGFMISPAVDAYGRAAAFTWTDPRSGGLSVFGTELSWTTTGIDDDTEILLPSGYFITQNYPNPFNPATVIEFSIPVKTDVTVTIYNLLGKRVAVLADGEFEAGDHSLTWDGRDEFGNDAASGVYFYEMKGGGFAFSRKMILLK